MVTDKHPKRCECGAYACELRRRAVYVHSEATPTRAARRDRSKR